jgi:hypothetical protein
MKVLYAYLTILWLSPSWAASEFEQYPAVKSVSTCKELDFGSYFRAQDHKKHLIRDNPGLSRPNFGGKYLLLKQELLMETLWLIADCETGKFHHETLTGLAEFKPDSLLVILTKPKSDRPAEFQLWKGDEWTRLDSPEASSLNASGSPVPGASPGPAAASTAPVKSEAMYATLFSRYPTEAPIATCKDLDYNSYFRAQSAKGNLIKLNPERSKPNFAGKYLLLRNDLMFERIWLIADCTTGKFLNQMIQDNAEFRPDSALIVVRQSSDYAHLILWRDERFVHLLNPVRTGKQEIENEVFDQDARTLMDLAGIPKNDSRGSFEDLRCVGQNCTIRKFPDPKPQVLAPELAHLAESVLKKWGGEFREGTATGYSIENGKCRRQKSNPVCEIRLSR